MEFDYDDDDDDIITMMIVMMIIILVAVAYLKNITYLLLRYDSRSLLIRTQSKGGSLRTGGIQY